MVRVNVNRMLLYRVEIGFADHGFVCFVLTVLVPDLGFVYGKSNSRRRCSCWALPMPLVALLSVVHAHRIRTDALEGDALFKQLDTHRLLTQVMGMVSIFVTAMWGMYGRT